MSDSSTIKKGSAKNPVANLNLFQPLKVSRNSQAVADYLRCLIQEGKLEVGCRLPAERELAEQLGVSRVMLREALQSLRASGLITAKIGAAGGAIVTLPSGEVMRNSITDLLAMSALTPQEVSEARSVIELGIVGLVCERATEEDIAELSALCDQAQEDRENGVYDSRSSVKFHLRVAAIARNPAVNLLLSSIEQPILRTLIEAGHKDMSGVHEHRAFVGALASRDVDLARRIMRDHLSRTAARVSAHH